MSDGSPIARAADAFGLHRGYHDIWGHYHALAEETSRAILGALGVDTADEGAIEAAIEARERARWVRTLAPVHVVHEDDACTIPIALGERHWDASLVLTVDTEDGARHEVEVRVADQPVIDERDVAGIGWVRRIAAALPIAMPLGYHRVSLDVGDGRLEATLVRAPRRCYPAPRRPDGGRLWGVSLQLYALRSGRNWGIGDFGDLARAAGVLADKGADLVGINPIHALFPHRPALASPYSPSSRRFANPLHIDVEAVPDFAECEPARAAVAAASFQARLGALRDAPMVDYEGVAELKWRILALLHAHFRDHHLAAGSERGEVFRAFRDAGGEALARHAVFEAIGFAHGHEREHWPAGLDDPDSAATAAFATAHAVVVERQTYLQWLAGLQLEAAQARARAGGMAIGLYLDLAVGSDGAGADTWSTPGGFARSISLGAPPDDFALQGQVWGLSPWSPPRLEETAYAAWRDVLRANMRSAGALRIDHVIGLLRQFWVPNGGSAADGAYVQFPFEALLSILALESVRARCTVVGEDLGTVPDEAREGLYRYGALSYRVLWFEKHWHGDHSFIAPHHFPEQALVTVTTHDLPTLAGWWRGRDLEIRDALGLVADPEALDRLHAGRTEDRGRLLHALEGEGLRPHDPIENDDGTPTPALAEVIHRYAARSPAALMMVQMEDVLGTLEQANVPATVHEQPNWQRKLPLALEAWPGHPGLAALASALNAERPKD